MTNASRRPKFSVYVYVYVCTHTHSDLKHLMLVDLRSESVQVV